MLTAQGLINALDPTGGPIWIARCLGSMAERERSVYCHVPDIVEKCDNTGLYLMEAMQGQPVEERMHAAG